MDTYLLVIGILFCAGGVVPLAVAHFDPLPERQRHRMARMFRYRARRAGLRGRYDPSKRGSSGRYGSYEPADDEDRALFVTVGAHIESESAFFATETLWTDARLGWAGLVLFLIGGVMIGSSAFL